jgi:4-hydroxythreonine-4-phosphate dehydrogenase
MVNAKQIIITPGEPAGIGPDITLHIAQKKWPVNLAVIADPDLLSERAQQLQLTIPSTLNIIPVKLNAPCKAGKLNRDNSHYVIHCLELAVDYCLQKKACALVTGPVHKGILNEAGIAFSGHTEFLAARCHAAQSLMLFVTPKLKVALATTHIPLSAVPKMITQEYLISIIRLLHREMQTKFHLNHPKILVAGLNPHAGEMGHLGREEIDIIEPAIKKCLTENIHVVGPLPADTLFTEKHLTSADVILAMYHDQALPVVKFYDFSHAVNVTLGLPIVRTSVDHGTALELAGTNKADSTSLQTAIELAILFTSHSS